MIVAACGGSDDAPAATAPTAPAESAPEAPQEQELVDFIWVGPAIPTTGDPATAGPLQNILAVEQNTRPVSYDPSGLPGGGCGQVVTIGELRGELAESWEFLDDGLRLRIKFREGVLSPFGNEMTSADAKWSLDRMIENSGTGRFLMQRIAAWESIHHFSQEYDSSPVDIVDDYTVDVRIRESGALDVAVMTQAKWMVFDTTYLIENGHVTEEDPWAGEFLKLNSADFGPWTFTEDDFRPGEEIILTRNPNYYKPEELGNIGRLIMRAIPESATRAQLVITGEADYAGQLTSADYKTVESNGGTVLNCVSGDRDTLVLQQAEGSKFADVRVRQAVSLALDREAVAMAGYQGFGGFAATEGMSTAYRPPSTRSVVFDPARARELLAEAGYPDGFTMTLHYSPARPGPQSEPMAFNIQQQLADVGITAELILVPAAAEFQATFLEGRYEAIIYQAPPAIPDPAYAAGLYSVCGGYQNSYNYCSELHDFFQTQLQTVKPENPARAVALGNLSDVIVDTIDKIYLVDTGLPRAFSSAVDVSRYEHHPYATTVRVHHLSKN